MTIIVVGAGLSGAVMADRCARVLGKRVIVFEKRDHIAGNCYDYVNEDGHLINKYGLHLFHCNDPALIRYITQFSDWVRYDHTVVARVGSKLVPIPVNIETVNALCDQNLQTSEDMDAWLAANQVLPAEGAAGIRNGEDAAKARVGEKLFKELFEGYTKKQWNKSPAELDRSVLERIPVRRDHDPRYFSDKYQILPARGYTEFVRTMLDHPLIDVRVGVDFFTWRSSPEVVEAERIIYTGPIDRYFQDSGLPALEYRSINFEVERHDVGGRFYQERLVINEPSLEVPYTRTAEYKHLPMNRGVNATHTTIIREYSTDEGEPYYPVPNPRNQELYEKYRALAIEEEKKGVLFVGRCAQYKYLNMHEAIAESLALFETRVL